MGFVLGQYNKVINIDDNIFMSYETDGIADFITTKGNSGVVGTDVQFTNECCTGLGLKENTSYYFHGKIYKLDTAQSFYIKLINKNATEENYIEQYIKTIYITQKNDGNNWVDVEFIFTPIQNFDTILFEMVRTTEDFNVEQIITIGGINYHYYGRKAYIGYVELSQINDIISQKIKNNVELLKIGVQSRPGLLMCINNEGIRTSRSGIYELKEGIMKIYSFSVVNASKETETGVQDWMSDIEDGQTILSQCFFNNTIYPKARAIDNFTLDYIYEDK